MENIPECAARIRAAVEQGRLQEAMDLVDANLAEYGNHPEFLKAEALLCGQSGEYDTAIALLKRAAERAPEDGEIYYFLVKCYEKNFEKTSISEEYSGITIIDTDAKEPVQYEDDLNLYTNRRAGDELVKDEDDPLVSIYFLAYNNLEKYTIPAIEALIRYTRHIDYEILLIDNGSTDGTFEYFKSLQFKRKRIYRVTKNLGALYPMLAIKHICGGRVFRGKYTLILPNDIIVTRNWLKNMLICIESDERIGMVVPRADNVSNLQSVGWTYTDPADMQAKAALFNKSNPSLWEERIRLITLAQLIPTNVLHLYDFDNAFIHNFADDDISFAYRRLGYKLILCGDTFIHHAGSVVLKTGTESFREDIEKGKKIFGQKYYGIDAWEDVINFECEMVQYVLLDAKVKNENLILGVDVRCGTPLLDLKNGLRRKNMYDTKLSAFTSAAKYWQDLSSICDNGVYDGPIEQIQEKIRKNYYDYIIWAEYINTYDEIEKLVLGMFSCLSKDGRLVFKVKRFSDANSMEKIFELMKAKKGKVKDYIEMLETIIKRHELQTRVYVRPISAEMLVLKNILFQKLHQYLVSEKDGKKIWSMFTEELFDFVVEERIVVIYNPEKDVLHC